MCANIGIVSPLQVIVCLVSSEHDGSQVRLALACGMFDTVLNASCTENLFDASLSYNLFLMAAAWNGGPGNLNKWRKATEYMNDPLFFIESIPVRETRNFIEHVLSNLWIYRNRLGQKTPSLDAVAAGEWPHEAQAHYHKYSENNFEILNLGLQQHAKP